MKKLIWLSFALLASLWTAIIFSLLKASDWFLAAIASAQIPAALSSPTMPIPSWAAPWTQGEWLLALQQTLLGLTQGLATVLPMAGGLSGLFSLVGWTIWGVAMLPLLILAVALHWLVNHRRQNVIG